MESIEIYFCGFICHVGPSGKEGSERNTLVRSLLIADANHAPRLRTSADIVPDDHRDAHKSAKSVRNSDSNLHWLGAPLTADVSFSHLGFGADSDPLVRDCVPHLDDLTHSGIELHPDPSGLWVTLPAGLLTIVEFYKDGATWKLDGDTNVRPCVPRVTMLRTSGNSPGITFNNQTVSLSSGWVLITNLETTPSNDPDGVHWKKQHAVTTGGENDIAAYAPLAATGITCTRRPSSGTHSDVVLRILSGPLEVIDSSECTNSHWP